MSWKQKVVLVCVVSAVLCATRGWGEESKGVISGTGLGSFTINDGGTLRQFNLSSKNTLYAPATWRPMRGDDVRVAFTPIQNKRGNTVLAVDRVTLVKAGPDTLVDVPSPAMAEIVETGRSGIRARIADGHVLRFAYGRGVRKSPPGWVPVVGEKAKISFRIEPGFGFGLNYVADAIEKSP